MKPEQIIQIVGISLFIIIGLTSIIWSMLNGKIKSIDTNLKEKIGDTEGKLKTYVDKNNSRIDKLIDKFESLQVELAKTSKDMRDVIPLVPKRKGD